MSTASRRVFGLWSEILAWICPRQGLNLALEKLYALVATVGGSPILYGVKSAVITGVGMAIKVDGQLEVGGYFRQILGSGECVCVCFCPGSCSNFAFSPESVITITMSK